MKRFTTLSILDLLQTDSRVCLFLRIPQLGGGGRRLLIVKILILHKKLYNRTLVKSQ